MCCFSCLLKSKLNVPDGCLSGWMDEHLLLSESVILFIMKLKNM